ncbi:MAG: mandelate racemase/muconate lactonizing enzyme family protein [Actinomycetota bacterium]
MRRHSNPPGLAAKAAGLPLYRYLGGNRDRLPAYASFGEVREPDRRAEDALAAMEQGFRAIKLRPRHATIDEDVAEVRTVRRATGEELVIACDANQGWRVDVFAEGPRWDLERAVATARAFEEFGIEWLEEPLDQFDFEGYRQLRTRTSTPISGGELAGDIWPLREMIERRAVDIVQPDATFTGGIAGTLEMAALAREAGIGFSPHTWSNGLGLLANMHVLAATDGRWLEYPYDPPGWVPEARDAMLSQPIRIDGDGMVPMPSGPGLGVELDVDRIEACGTAI